jgi:hypothetical protein
MATKLKQHKAINNVFVATKITDRRFIVPMDFECVAA